MFKSISPAKLLLITAFAFHASSVMAEELYPIEEKGKWGFINKSGKVVVTPQYEFAGNYYDGMASVKSGGKYGFVDGNGKLAITATYDKTTDFADGMAGV